MMSVITDYNNTYAVVTYQDRAMKWNIPIYSQNNYPVRVGYSYNAQVQEYPFSYVNLRAPNISTTKFMLEKIDDVDETSALLSGVQWNNIGMKMHKKGKLGFKLTNNGLGFKHHGKVCMDWINSDRTDSTNVVSVNDAKTCPCVKSQMIEEFYHRLSSARIPNGYVCYITASAASGVDPRSRRCCYDVKGQLIKDHNVVNGMNTYQRNNGSVQEMDDVIYDSCCKPIYSHYVKTSLCGQFLQQRPVSTCDNFESSSVGKFVFIYSFFVCLCNYSIYLIKQLQHIRKS